MTEQRKYAVEMPARYEWGDPDEDQSIADLYPHPTGGWTLASDVISMRDKMQDEIDRLKVLANKRMNYIADVTVVLDTKVGETAIKAAKRLMSQLAAEREKAAKAREEALREAAMEVELALCGIPNASEQIQNGRDKKAILALIDKEGAK